MVGNLEERFSSDEAHMNHVKDEQLAYFISFDRDVACGLN